MPECDTRLHAAQQVDATATINALVNAAIQNARTAVGNNGLAVAVLVSGQLGASITTSYLNGLSPDFNKTWIQKAVDSFPLNMVYAITQDQSKYRDVEYGLWRAPGSQRIL